MKPLCWGPGSFGIRQLYFHAPAPDRGPAGTPPITARYGALRSAYRALAQLRCSRLQ